MKYQDCRFFNVSDEEMLKIAKETLDKGIKHESL